MLIPLFIAAGVVTFSRTGLVSIGVSLALNSLHLGVRRYLLVIAACVLVFVVVWGVASNTRVGRRVADYRGSLDERQELWSRAGEVAVQHPFVGIGRGNWEAVSGSPTLPHNTFLSIAAHTGLAGLALFLAPVVVWVARGLRRPSCRRWAIAVLVGLAGGVAVSLDNFRLFWLAVGLLVAGLAAAERARAGEQAR
jgi:O-antigen ligase